MSLLLLLGGYAPYSGAHPSTVAGPGLNIEMAFGYTWQDDTKAWTDVTPWVDKSSLSIDFGRKDELQAFPPSTCGFTLDNSERLFDPSYEDGPYFDDLLPAVPVRVLATWAGVTYPLFFGYVSSWPVTSSVVNRVSLAPIQATDSLDLLGNADYSANVWTLDDPILGRLDAGNRVGGGDPVVGGSSSGARVSGILDLTGYPASLRDIDPGVATVQDDVLDGSPRDSLRAMELAEDGWLWQGPDGVIHFYDRHSSQHVARMSTSQVTFSDGDGDYPYRDLTFDYSLAYVYNDVTRTVTDGVPQEVTDEPSIRKFFRHSHELTDLQNTSDTDARALAKQFLSLHKDPAVRPDSFVVDPGNNRPNLWPQVLGRQVLDRITIVRHPQDIGDPVVADWRIEGGSHQMTGNQWITTWTLSPVDDTPYWTLDDAVLGLLDSGNLIGA